MLIRRNEYLDKRIGGLLSSLDSAYAASIPLSSFSKGNEREWFVSNLLEKVFPTHYRFSSGEITDRYTNISGQIDIVVEHPHRYSLASFQGGPRLFMAESVASAIEVKSNLKDQWKQVRSTVQKIKQVRRTFSFQYWENILQELESGVSEEGKGKIESDPVKLASLKKNAKSHLARAKGKGSENIPIYVVGYKGWEDGNTIKEKVKELDVAGIFQIENRIYTSGGYVHSGNDSLYRFLNAIEDRMNETILLEPSYFGYSVSSGQK